MNKEAQFRTCKRARFSIENEINKARSSGTTNFDKSAGGDAIISMLCSLRSIGSRNAIHK